MKKLNVIFFGTDKFSVPFLLSLINDKDIYVKYVVTKQDKKEGRGYSVKINPVAKSSQQYNIPTIKITSLLKDPSQLSTIKWSTIDYAIVVSFGFIFPEEVLSLLKNKFINVHPSMLPKYRGPSPIIATLINGDNKTGVSIMVLENNVDAGPVLHQQPIDIHQSDDINTLTDRVIQISPPLLVSTLKKYAKNEIEPVKQQESKATYTSKVTKQDGFVTLSDKPTQIYNKYRALKNWPKIYTDISNIEKFLGIRTKIADKGQTVKLTKVLLKDPNKLAIQKLQLPNKPEISLSDFTNGYGVK